MNAKQIHQRHTSVEWLVLWKAKVSLWTMERHKYTLSWNNNYCADCGNDKMQLPVIIRACTRYIYMQTATRWCWSNIRGTQSSSNKNLILHLILLSLTHTHTQWSFETNSIAFQSDMHVWKSRSTIERLDVDTRMALAERHSGINMHTICELHSTNKHGRREANTAGRVNKRAERFRQIECISHSNDVF